MALILAGMRRVRPRPRSASNAMAPDEGNMHTLLIAGNPEQLETYLRPGLAEGRNAVRASR